MNVSTRHYLLSLFSLFAICNIGQAHAQVVCIDPGHPSEVGSGTEGKHITEMMAAWLVGCKLRDDLQAQGITVVMTKNSESEFVKNKRRAEIANEAHADLMIRLHCDADAGTGFAVYAPDRQGHTAGVTGPTPDVIAESQVAAKAFHAAVAADFRGFLADRGLLPDTSTRVGAMQGALTGSIFSRVPVLLIEMCVLTNPRDEALIDNSAGQTRFAAALADGVQAALTATMSKTATNHG